MYEDLERLNTLREKGAITEEEYQKEKERIFKNLDAKQEQKSAVISKNKLWGMDERGYCTLLQISQFAGILVPFAGYILSVVMWLSGKDDSEIVDKNGRMVINWIISLMIYLFISGIMCMLVIGIPMLIALGIINIIFVIKGTIAANKGEFWEYPMTIKFF